jgi:hypothetical protein
VSLLSPHLCNSALTLPGCCASICWCEFVVVIYLLQVCKLPQHLLKSPRHVRRPPNLSTNESRSRQTDRGERGFWTGGTNVQQWFRRKLTFENSSKNWESVFLFEFSLVSISTRFEKFGKTPFPRQIIGFCTLRKNNSNLFNWKIWIFL